MPAGISQLVVTLREGRGFSPAEVANGQKVPGTLSLRQAARA